MTSKITFFVNDFQFKQATVVKRGLSGVQMIKINTTTVDIGAHGIWCLADCSDEGLELETPAIHHISQATNIPYQPLLIKPIFSVLAHAENSFFQN